MDMMDTCDSLSIKVSFRGELRRFLAQRNLNFEDLENKLMALFALAPKSFMIKYEDEDKDLITVSSNEELSVAISTAINGILRLMIIERGTGLGSTSPAPAPAAAPAPAPALAAAPTLAPHESRFGVANSSSTSSSMHGAPSPMMMLHPYVPSPAGYAPPPMHGYYPPSPVGGGGAVPSPATGYPPVLYAGAEWRKKIERKVSRKQNKIAEKVAKRHEKIHHKLEKMERKHPEGVLTPKQQGKVAHKFEKLSEKKERKEAKLATKAEKYAQREAKKAGKKCTDEADLVGRFVGHVSLPEGSSPLAPFTPFIKTWRFRNDGTRPWPEFTRLVFLSKQGDQLGAPPAVSVAGGKQIFPGETVDVSVPMVAPSLPGDYFSFWRLRAPSGKKFGQRVVVHLTVTTGASSSPPPFAPSSSSPPFAPSSSSSSGSSSFPASSASASPYDAPVPMEVTDLAKEAGMESDAFVKKLHQLGLTIAKKE